MPVAAAQEGGPSAGGLVPLCRIVTPVGMLGYGLDEAETRAALDSSPATTARGEQRRVPTALIMDSGSTDSGPEKLALGGMSCPRAAYARDLAKLLRLVHAYRTPLVFSSAGGDGADEHVEEMLRTIEEIVAEEGNEHYSFKVVAIFAGVSKRLIIDRLRAGAITGCGSCVPELTEEDVLQSPRVVAQMGPEPFTAAMRANPDFDIIIGGRAYDPAPYVGYAAFLLSSNNQADIDIDISISSGSGGQGGAAAKDDDDDDDDDVNRGLLLGGFTHMGKIMECGGACAEPKSHGATATVYASGVFDVAPMTAGARCTPVSVAAHTMYEKTRPDILHGPGGYLDLNHATYEQLDDGRAVRVRGSLFRSSRQDGKPYQVKLEAGSVVGYRSMYMGSMRDPILISQIDGLTQRIKAYVADQHRTSQGTWELDFHYYGKPDKPSQPQTASDVPPPELFIIGEVLASSQDLADSVAATAKVANTHASYPGQKATSGNLAFGLGGKMTIPLGPCARFSVYHLMDLQEGEEGLACCDHESSPDDPRPLFTQKVTSLGKGQGRSSDGTSGIERVTPGFLPLPTLPKANGVTAAGGRSSSGSDDGNKSTATTTATTTTTTTTAAAAAAAATDNSDPAAAAAKAKAFPLLPANTLGSVARVLRSKNAGPYEITFDVLFGSAAAYAAVRQSGALSAAAVASALGLPAAAPDDDGEIVWCGFFDPARAFKVTIPRTRGGGGRGRGRRCAGGGFMESDIHGSQRYLPLMYMRLPDDLVAEIEKCRSEEL
ncbi:hypothetical protein GGR56DRAFT_693645 [Xylariaceae sp. FL0804]|nr:hypothetical protein GGR56DRAFT_693645 [Xylariaceae sp. FL0804]